ncbi:MAG: S-adenosyl-l-methionine hydroxide adenosyltransferase family protein [Syntrophobacteraceae bacterium]
MNPPIITLLTDFGLQDGYVASMKGVILGICPDAKLVDISHLVAPRDVRSGAFVLYTSYEFFPQGTIHLAVVDPGVGTERSPIAIRAKSCFFVGPDNGLFSFVLKETGWEARRLENRQFWKSQLSSTFHGRDLFAPVAAHIARGAHFDDLGPSCDPVLAQWGEPIVGKGQVEGEVIHIDHFGNAIINVMRETLEKQGPAEKWTTSAGKTVIHSIQQTYGRVSAGKALALTGSSGLIEIAVNHGNAASELGLRSGTKVTFRLSKS